MLKIKDDVDFKILENYGFELIEDCYIPVGLLKPEIITCYVYTKGGTPHSHTMFIKTNYLREIVPPLNDLDVLYDLIKADLVEKI